MSCFAIPEMLFDDKYFSVNQPSTGAYKDRRSKFLAFVFPVKSEVEIKEILLHLKKEHHGANHHCYAWRLGADKAAFRANDDGEPNNSAGKPILGQIQSKDLTDVLIVVARYFGGTLLGVSGLINAYREAAADALKNAEIIEKHILFQYRVEFSFEQMNSVMRVLRDNHCKIISNEYESNCVIIFDVRKSYNDQVEEQIMKLTPIKFKYLKTH